MARTQHHFLHTQLHRHTFAREKSRPRKLVVRQKPQAIQKMQEIEQLKAINVNMDSVGNNSDMGTYYVLCVCVFGCFPMVGRLKEFFVCLRCIQYQLFLSKTNSFSLTDTFSTHCSVLPLGSVNINTPSSRLRSCCTFSPKNVARKMCNRTWSIKKIPFLFLRHYCECFQLYTLSTRFTNNLVETNIRNVHSTHGPTTTNRS